MKSTQATNTVPALPAPVSITETADPAARLIRSQEISAKAALALQTRTGLALKRYAERVGQAFEQQAQAVQALPATPWDAWVSAAEYAIDFAQRSLLFGDTLRQRGNNFIEHAAQGLPPVLHFDYEMVMDGRSFARRVNYALVRIVPPAGVTVDAKRRPYVIIDPRGGHGPGIGGFKDDSQVGVALRAGHPVYFVIYFPDPEPGQTLLDVCQAEREFVRHVRTLHPDAPKPGIVGNCQAGWAAMMLASNNPDDTGPVVVVGAPMSYWGGAWSEAEGDNPMRYAGGLLGGSWLASLSSDLGAGTFDGAWLVQNFENLNPANTFWDKYYRVFADIDTEAARFLEFERWWGGYYLMNRAEIEWITQNLFVGNKLWSGAVKSGAGRGFDLRQIKVPIVLFASMGDNITPPQQAFNWVADVYASTDEIKSHGQVIVALMHEQVGHLGIFVSGQVAKKEGTQIASVLQSIEALPPGLYGMQIDERQDAAGKPAYEVSFVELRLEEVAKRLNRFERDDEKIFEAVAAVSDFNQRAYELFARPLAQALANPHGAKLSRDFHPLRLQRWAISDLNPCMWWLAPAAQVVKVQRRDLGPEHPARRIEAAMSELTSASLDAGRALRDALAETTFFLSYGNLFALASREPHGSDEAVQPVDPRELPWVRQALAAADRGGYAEAVARVAVLLARTDEPLPLSRLQLAQEMIDDYRALLPELTPDEARRIGGEQEIIARFEPVRAVETLPLLLDLGEDRERLVTLLERVLADRRMQQVQPSAEQKRTLARIRTVLESAAPSGARARGAPGKRLAVAAARG